MCDSPWTQPTFTRYMKARRAEIDALMDVETYESYEKSWLQVRDMSVLTLRDHLEVQYHLPLLLIRLGKESDLCKYLKWYETKPYQNYRHFENLEDKTADIFEPVDVLCEAITDPYNLQCPDLYNMFCVMLLKAKILLDLQKVPDSPNRRDIARVVYERLSLRFSTILLSLSG
ncbi:hypothetical protein BKA80DRAFT_323267 [Phyllosticta citrichinensis]